MPDTPAEHQEMNEKQPQVPEERLATPEELAEYGAVLPDPSTEAEILALLEEDLAKPEEAEATEIAEAAEPLLMEGPPEVQPAACDLLEFAGVLDQHRVWLQSGGKEGVRADLNGANLSNADLTGIQLQGANLQKANLRGADLSMANLRATNLVEADLRETHLLGTEFSGANLMGANLFGAQGLWTGRLGGTNLFDATLPEGVSAQDGSKTLEQATRAAKRFYLLLMGLCAFSLTLIALTTDARLLRDLSAIPSARIPNFLPLQGFYLGVPLLLTIFFLRLQFLLLRLWAGTGTLPAVFPNGETPDADGAWYLMGPVRTLQQWSKATVSPLGVVESQIAKALAYWAVPGTLFFFWLRYLVMQDYRGSLLQVFLFTLAASAACVLPKIVLRVMRPSEWSQESTPQFVKSLLTGIRAPLAGGLALFLLSLGVIRGLPADGSVHPEVSSADPRRWAATMFHAVGYHPYANVTEAAFSTAPQVQANEAAPLEANGARLNEMTLRYAHGYRAAFANARMWRANLEGASFSEGDFRGANLRESVLRSAALDRMQGTRANLVSTDARGANFSGADLRNADISYGNLEGATLSTANLGRATLYAVNLRNAKMLRTDFSHADLRDVKMENAEMPMGNLQETDLSGAKMNGVNLTGAQMNKTILLEADLSKADLRGATLTGAILREARLDGAQLQGADLRGTLGLNAQQICSAQGWQDAQLDPDLLVAVSQRCGNGTVPAALVNPDPSARATPAAVPTVHQ